MPRSEQRLTVSPPSTKDEGLQDYSSVIQQNFEDIFEVGHSHDLLGQLPNETDGVIGDIQLVNDGTNYYLCAKFSDGWKKVILS